MNLVKLNHENLLDRLTNEAYFRNMPNSFLENKEHGNCNLDYYINENETTFDLELAIPGFSKNDIDIVLENGMLLVKSKENSDGEKILGFASKSFEKRFKLSRNVNQENISAIAQNGVLKITLPKVESIIPKPARSIEIA